MIILAERLKELKLTDQQHRIADYFLKGEGQIGNMSPMDVAKEIGVGDVSIIRFSRVIGYKRFTDLKNDIYNSLAGEANAVVRNMQLSDRFDVLSGKFNDQNIPGTFVELMNYNITKTFHQNPVESYGVSIGTILMSKRKYITGLRDCTGVVGHFAWLLEFTVNQAVTLPHNETEVAGVLQNIGPGDIFILFSFARYHKVDMFLINMVEFHKTGICVATDSPLVLIIPCSDISFIAGISHMSFFNLTISIKMIGEYIVTLVRHKNSEEYRK